MDADLLPVLVHIQAGLDQDLSLAALATASGLSESTLKRRIEDTTGQTPRQYVERLRLERAASQLLLRDSTVLDVALDNGFASHEVFTRAFSRHFGLTPREWRDRDSAGGLGSNGRDLGLTEGSVGVSLSSTRLVEMRPVEIAFLRHVGPYGEIDGNSWADIRQRLRDLSHSDDGLPVGIGHDSPEITPPEHLRFDAGWTIDESLPPECGLGQQTVPGGTYAVTTYVGPFSMLGLAYGEISTRIMQHADRLSFGAGDFLGSVEWYRTGSIDEDSFLNQVDITFPVTARAGGDRVLEYPAVPTTPTPQQRRTT